MENDVQVATSATPAEALPDFSTLSSTQMADYMKTGEFPSETKPKTDATAEPGQDATGKSGAASDAAEPTTTTQEPPKPNREERRNQRLNNENRELKARLEALEKAQTKPAETKAATSDAKIPKLKDYATTEEWEDAKDEWHEKRTASAVREALRVEREAQKQADQQAESEKQSESLTKTFGERLKDHIKATPAAGASWNDDLAEVNNYIKKSEVGYLADALAESEVGPQLITYFAEHFDEFEAIAKLSPNAALREFGRLEVSDKIKGPAPKTRTAAKKIGSEVRGSSAVTDEDEQLERAAKTGDMKTYQRIMDKREAAENRR